MRLLSGNNIRNNLVHATSKNRNLLILQIIQNKFMLNDLIIHINNNIDSFSTNTLNILIQAFTRFQEEAIKESMDILLKLSNQLENLQIV
tara:strand:+ start:1077 stop:1346 length:270 start_codon:yes stop_codon:yes gene_type:complete